MATSTPNPKPPGAEPHPGVPDGRREKMETIGRLASGVAHDFANLVTLITGYTEIVLNQLDADDPRRADLLEIRKAADRGARLTGQLLGFTRGNGTHPQTLDLNHVVFDLERMLRHIIGENIELITDCAPDLARVAVDPGQIEQVIINLILNARDAMPMGGRIRIQTSNAELSPDIAEHQGMRAGECVLLIVADTGHGIDPSDLNHIFEPFFTTKEKGRGTGLGLSTVREVVQKSGGAVWVASQYGQGATFTVCLPKAGEVPGNGPQAVLEKSHGGTETVLLVEDDQSVRSLLARLLRDRGYRILQASNSEEALRVLDSGDVEVHLVLTDIIMPGMSGLELACRLRESQPDLRIICMSGYAEEILTQDGSFSPGIPFLRKPLRPGILEAKVREALDSPPLPFDPR